MSGTTCTHKKLMSLLNISDRYAHLYLLELEFGVRIFSCAKAVKLNLLYVSEQDFNAYACVYSGTVVTGIMACVCMQT